MSMQNPFATLALSVALAASAFPAVGAKPVDQDGVPFGNGAPSGPHFNLVLLGKQAHFVCPPPELDELGNPVYGNVIFIPREQGDDPITILMESGSKGPKGSPETATLEVTDWCTESFPDDGTPGDVTLGDGAILRLPAASAYAVYARILGKPGAEGEPTVTAVPGLSYVADETGNDLLLLGLVDRGGISKFGSDSETLYRTSTTSAGKGAKQFSNMTALFEWTGEVCYVQSDTEQYCGDESSNDVCAALELCCTDADADSVYESCSELSEVGETDTDGITLICPLDTDPVTAACRSYDNDWVFNISDFVGYLWALDSTGAYNIQVRFYPVY
jgi:hypothetical protein